MSGVKDLGVSAELEREVQRLAERLSTEPDAATMFARLVALQLRDMRGLEVTDAQALADDARQNIIEALSELGGAVDEPPPEVASALCRALRAIDGLGLELANLSPDPIPQPEASPS